MSDSCTYAPPLRIGCTIVPYQGFDRKHFWKCVITSAKKVANAPRKSKRLPHDESREILSRHCSSTVTCRLRSAILRKVSGYVFVIHTSAKVQARTRLDGGHVIPHSLFLCDPLLLSGRCCCPIHSL